MRSCENTTVIFSAQFTPPPRQHAPLLSSPPARSYAAHLLVFRHGTERLVRVRVHGLPELTRFTMLKAASVGKFVALQGVFGRSGLEYSPSAVNPPLREKPHSRRPRAGTVVRVSNIRPMVLGMEFGCLKCGHRQGVDFKACRPPLPAHFF